MGKISGFFVKQKNFIKDIYKTYTATILSVIAMTFILVIFNHIDENEFYEHSIFILLCFAIWSLFFESCFYKKSQNVTKRLLLTGTGVFVSVILDIIAYNITDKSDKVTTYFYYFLAFYAIFFVGSALFVIIKKQEISFHEYIARVIFGLLRAAGLFLVLYIATVLLLELFDNLVMDIDYWNTITDIEIIIAGFIYFPVCLVTLVKTEEENSKFTKGVITYALMPCVMIAVLIIYIYIVKIFVTWEIPSNEIFYICAWLFALAAPVWTMAYAFTKDKNSIYAKLIKYMKYIYAPFIFLEIYAIGVRIYECGVTESRYIAVVFIIFQIVYELWELILVVSAKIAKKEKKPVFGCHYEYMILILIAFAFISLLFPVLNVTHVSYLSQKSIFLNNKDSDVGAACEAYYYLKTNPYGKDWMDKNLTKAELKELQEKYYDKVYNTRDENKLEWEYVHNNGDLLSYGFDISEYKKIYSSSCGYYNEEYTNEECKSIELRIGKDNRVNIDITDCLSYYADIDENPEQYSDEQKTYRIDIDENRVFVISQIYFHYIGDMSRIKDLSISGYVLEK